VIYGLGIEEFKIFDMKPVPEAAINIGDRCYIGKETEERTQIDHVRARVNYKELTHTAQSELVFVLDEIVRENEEKFIQFYNHAGPISRRYHSLELIPGLGKKTMNLIVKNRPYTAFREMEEKIPNFRNPEKYISHRIENEIKETDQKYRLFVR
jgi:putative nucleotide binding protein